MNQNMSKFMTDRWAECERFGEILGKTKQEIWNNYELCKKYENRLLMRHPYFIDLVLREGKWHNEDNLDKERVEQKHKQRVEQERLTKKAKKYAKLLGKPEEEVFLRLPIVMKHSKQIRFGLIWPCLKEAWPETWDEEAHQKELQERTENARKQIKEHNERINLREKHIKAKEDVFKTECKGPMDDLKIMLWTINKIGSLEKAEKIFQAAKLALEAMES